MNEDAEQAARERLLSLPIECLRVAAGGWTWRIEMVVDQGALLAASDGLDAFPFGLMLWEAGVALADHVAAAGPGLVAGSAAGGRLRVLELGAGVGLAGLMAARLGADVVQTDHSAEALALCRRNAGLNGVLGVSWWMADWRAWPADLTGFDVILGADVLYDAVVHDAVLEVSRRALVPGGLLLLSDPSRPDTDAFVTRLKAAGFEVTESGRKIPALVPVHVGQTVAVRLIEAVALG